MDSQNNTAGWLYTYLALAREWQWIHAWIFSPIKEREIINSISLPEHRNLRLQFYKISMAKSLVVKFFVKWLARFVVLFKLIERSSGRKKRKKFDAVLVQDTDLLRWLSFTKPLFKVPVYPVRNILNNTPVSNGVYPPGNILNDTPVSNGVYDELWVKRANKIIEFMKSGKAPTL